MTKLHPALSNIFFSPLLPSEQIDAFLSTQSNDNFSSVLQELITFINYTTLSIILESLSTVQGRQQFMNSFIFRYTDTDFFDTFKEQHTDVLPIIVEKIERTLLSILSDGETP